MAATECLADGHRRRENKETTMPLLGGSDAVAVAVAVVDGDRVRGRRRLRDQPEVATTEAPRPQNGIINCNAGSKNRISL